MLFKYSIILCIINGTFSINNCFNSIFLEALISSLELVNSSLIVFITLNENFNSSKELFNFNKSGISSGQSEGQSLFAIFTIIFIPLLVINLD